MSDQAREQYGLFGGMPPAQRHSPTSVEAAEAIRPRLHALQAVVLTYLKRCGSHGATDDEIQVALRMDGNVQRPRRVELVALGLVRITERTRKTRRGRAAGVWVAIGEGK